MTKRLYRSRTNRMIWGVCGGLADYFDIDPTVIRIIFALLVFAGGLGLFAYVVMAIIVPLEGSAAATPGDTVQENVRDIKESSVKLGREIQSAFGRQEEPQKETIRPSSNGRTILALILIVIGLFFLLNNFGIFGIFGWSNLWPIVLIIIGVLIIITTGRR